MSTDLMGPPEISHNPKLEGVDHSWETQSVGIREFLQLVFR